MRCGRLRNSAIARSARRAPRSLWLVYAVTTLHAYTYYSFAAVVTPLLSDNIGLDDAQSGYVYTAIGLLASIYGSLIGLIIDELSVFAAALAGVVCLATGRLLLLYAVPLDGSHASIVAAAVVLVTFFPCGDVLVAQAMRIGIKRYVPDEFLTPAALPEDESPHVLRLAPRAEDLTGPKRTIEYSAAYSFSNTGALLAFATVWAFTSPARPSEVTNAFALLAGVAALGICGCVALAGLLTDSHDINRELAERERTMLEAEAERTEDAHTGRLTRWARFVVCVCPPCCSPYLCIGAMGGLFARYLYVSFALVGAKTLFRQIDATIPKYTQRMFYEGFPYAALMMINPLLCLVLAPFAQPLLERFETQRLFIAGTLLCALATALGMVPSAAALVAFCVVITLGEITWSPRYEDWTWRAAPKGQEGAFGSVALAPLFLGKMGAGLASGYLLERFCPKQAADGPCVSWGVWGPLAAMGITSPLLLAAAHRWIKRGDTPLDERPLDTDIIVLTPMTSDDDGLAPEHPGRGVRRRDDTSASDDAPLTPKTDGLLDRRQKRPRADERKQD
jgi:predicted MFS family arabinose efflux permease